MLQGRTFTKAHKSICTTLIIKSHFCHIYFTRTTVVTQLEISGRLTAGNVAAKRSIPLIESHQQKTVRKSETLSMNKSAIHLFIVI